QYGREIYTWTWPIVKPAEVARKVVDTAGASAAALVAGDTSYTLSANGVKAVIGKGTGLLRAVQNAKGAIPFVDGPALTVGSGEFIGLNGRQEGNNAVLEASYAKNSLIQELKWTMYPSGWLKMEIHYFPPDYEYNLLGINFSFPESGVKGIRWLGNGPYRVWKNRMQGSELGVWDKAYNNTVTGFGNVVYPEFKGYFSNFYWMRMETAGQPFTVVCGNEDVFLRLFTPADPPGKTYNTAPEFPAGNISFMQAIPAIGTKSQKPEKLGPSGGKSMYYDYGRSKEYAKVITLYFDFSGK
ncbi:MAG: glycoside hydrolase family 2, partial [Bacteroidetes bacterium]|nr:glycoside hydrolase family 2 [Bacteroidota bacterium]